MFDFVRKPNLPALSNWVVDFNAFFDTGVSVPVNNKARMIDSVLATELESLPGFAGLMAILATQFAARARARSAQRPRYGEALQRPALTEAQLKSGLPADEVAVLDEQNKLLLKKTRFGTMCCAKRW